MRRFPRPGNRARTACAGRSPSWPCRWPISNPTLCTTSEQAIYRLLRFSFKNQSALMPLLLLFRKKARLLRLFACKRAHDASAALPIFCGASAVIFGQNNHIANSMQKRLKRLFFLWHFKLMGFEAAFSALWESSLTTDREESLNYMISLYGISLDCSGVSCQLSNSCYDIFIRLEVMIQYMSFHMHCCPI